MLRPNMHVQGVQQDHTGQFYMDGTGKHGAEYQIKISDPVPLRVVGKGYLAEDRTRVVRIES